MRLNLKNTLAEYLLKRKLRHHTRERELKNLDQCHSILLIGNGNDDEGARQMSIFSAHLRSIGKEVFTVFLPPKKRNTEITYGTDIKLIEKDHLNLLSIPRDPQILDLMNRKFDLLVDLSLSERYPLKYIHALSKVRFRVGAAMNYKKKFADLTIEINKDEAGVENLITQVKFYLSNINQHVA